ncbi:hypothetical protein RI129_008705 [Pyrocoelia pectoralis]|uniref:Prefoldin subunit 4 n=1 Tax=Pyrocoelia pectoralis TaxID=417401 RepID=A0AAN7V933_9COLE
MSSTKNTLQADSDVHITFEDQQKINKFARLNAKLEDLKFEIKEKENDLKKLEDACDEIVLLDETEKIPYLVGEVFIYQDIDQTQACLEESKNKTESEIAILKSKSAEIKDWMGDLKTYLYGKFGSNINLEADEE